MSEQPSLRQQEPDIPRPPRAWLKWSLCLRIGIAIAFFFAAIVGTTGCSAQAISPWRPANQVLSASVLDLVLDDAIASSVESPERIALKEAMKTWVLPGKDGNKLALIRFDSKQLCGSTGYCQYAAWWLQDTNPEQVKAMRVWADQLAGAPNKPLFETSPSENGEREAELPCFIVNQIKRTTPDGAYTRTRFCLNGNQYQLVNEVNSR